MHLDYLVSKVNVGHLGSLAPKENRVLQGSLDILVPWVLLDYLVLKGKEVTTVHQVKRGNRVLLVWMVL